jgi:hypothetical protein
LLECGDMGRKLAGEASGLGRAGSRIIDDLRDAGFHVPSVMLKEVAQHGIVRTIREEFDVVGWAKTVCCTVILVPNFGVRNVMEGPVICVGVGRQNGKGDYDLDKQETEHHVCQCQLFGVTDDAICPLSGIRGSLLNDLIAV